MSFSSDVKAELLSNITAEKNKKCKAAQLLAIINVCGFANIYDHDKFVVIHVENSDILNLAANLIADIFNTRPQSCNNEIVIRDWGLIKSMVNVLGISDSNDFSLKSPVDYVIRADIGCKRAYIRTVFFCCGSVSDPSRHYHIEFSDNDFEHAKALVYLIGDFGIEMKIVERKKHFVVYCKESEQIVDLLNVMSAHRALLKLENMRIVKEVRNNVNRIVNCETANINKVVSTALRQIEDINYIIRQDAMDSLPGNLKEIAEARIQYPDLSLKELGQCLSHPIGKSGVNHRLNKIHKIAEKLKGDTYYD